MGTLLRSTALALLVLGLASQASAGDKIWSVSGVVNNGLATVFSCTNATTAPVTVKVDVFLPNGTLDVTGSVNNVASNATVDLATKNVLSMVGGIELDMVASTMHSGSARIIVPSGVFCTAYVVDPVNNPPTSMKTLPVIKKTNQKGD